MIARVAPLLRLPRALGVFDYRIPDGMTVRIGSVVRIPFRRRSTIGVVLALTERSAFDDGKLRALEAALSEQALLPAPQLEAAQRIAEDSFTSIATTMRSIIPHFPLRTTIDLPPLSRPSPPSWRSALDEATRTAEAVALITYVYDDSRIHVYERLIARASQGGKSTLLITPTIARAEKYLRRYPQALLFHHDLGTTEKRQRFLSIRNGRSLVVVGTRSAVFAPITDLGLVIIDDEDADDHVQEEPSPRFDCRSVAAMLVEQTGGKLVLTSRLPSVRSFAHYGISQRLDAEPKLTIEFVNLDHQRDQGDYRILPEPAMAALRSVVEQGQRAVVVHHRRSLYSSLECRDCGFIPTCSRCHVPFRQERLLLVCRHCGQTESIPLTCPRCKGYSLRGRGRGIEHVVRELRAAGLTPALDDEHDARADHNLIVTTPQNLDDLPDQTCTVAIVTRYDSLFSVPRIDAEERAHRILRTLAAKLASGGRLIMQASSGYEQVSRTIFDDAMLKRSQDERERFGYPPAWHLLALRRRVVARAPGITASELVGTVKNLDPTLMVIGPQRSPARSRVDPGGDLVLLRYRGSLQPHVRSALTKLDERWSIVLDPLELH